MKPIFSNRHADALAKTVLCSGVVHLSLLAAQAARGNVEALNAFNILQLDLWFPSLHSGAFNFVVSYVVVLAIYGFAYLFLARPGAIGPHPLPLPPRPETGRRGRGEEQP